VPQFNETDLAILKSFLIFPYLTAEQVCELHYSRGSLKYVQERLPWLVKEGYLHRTRERPTASTPYLYTLALKGTRTLGEKPIFYPLEHKRVHGMHYDHLLLTNEVLISSLKLPQIFPDVTLWDIQHDFAIRHFMKGVRPDGWIDLRTKGEQIPVCFEIHIGSKPHEPKNKDKEKFQAKIAGILEVVKSEYQRVFGTTFVTWSWLTPYEDKVALLVSWTQEVLARRGDEREADLFRFAHIPEKDIDPKQLFLAPRHRRPFDSHGWTLVG